MDREQLVTTRALLLELLEAELRHGTHDQSSHGTPAGPDYSVDDWDPPEDPDYGNIAPVQTSGDNVRGWRMDEVPDEALNGNLRGKNLRETIKSRQETAGGADFSQGALRDKFGALADTLDEEESSVAQGWYRRAGAELDGMRESHNAEFPDRPIDRQQWFEASSVMSISASPEAQFVATRDLARAHSSGALDGLEPEEAAELLRETTRETVDVDDSDREQMIGAMTDKIASALRIMRGQSTLDDEYTTHSTKLRHYASNLANPDNESGVTMDGWMVDAAINGDGEPTGEKLGAIEWEGVTSEEADYDLGVSPWFQNAVAEEADDRNMLPHEMQSVVWHARRKIETGETPSSGPILGDDPSAPIDPEQL